MKKKALIVGISDYGNKLPRLDSPEREIAEWRDLLMDDYGFPCAGIRLLANERARREEIMCRLRWLFKDAENGDQLVFIFAGHGVRLTPRDPKSGEILDDMDEALLAYPSSASDDLQAMAIYDNQVFDVVGRSRVPETANVTFILDCCHGGGFNSRDFPRRPTVMSVTPPVDLRHRSLHGGAPPRRRVELPVLVNAAGELNLSVELDLEGERRSLFSYHALRSLRKNPKLTYDELLNEIREPIRQHYPQQHPNLRGNLERRKNQFLQ